MSTAKTKKIRRSRSGCHRCKRLKIKCTEERPSCSMCLKSETVCDYSLKLTWGGRPYKNKEKHASSISYNVSHQVNSSASQKIKFVPEKNPSNFKRELPAISMTYQPEARDSNTSVKVEVIPQSLCIKTEDPETLSGKDFPVALSSPYDHDPSELNASTLQLPNQNDTYKQPLMDPSKASHAKDPGLIAQDLFLLSPGLSPPDVESIIMLRLSPPTNFASDIPNDAYSTDIACIETLLPSAGKSPYFTDFITSPQKSSPIKFEAFSPISAYADGPEEEITSEFHDHELAVSLLNTIPPSLTPLPEILLKVSFYRELFHFWINVAAENMVPAPSHIYHDNPFKVILPQMAMHYPGLLTTILAFSANAKQALDPNRNNYQPVIDQLLRRSCDELLRLLYDKTEATSDGTLAMVLLLSGYETVTSNDFEKHRTHTTGASQIIYTRMGNEEENQGSVHSSSTSLTATSLLRAKDESDIAFFLMRWFVYIDVLGAIAATRGQDNYLRAYKGKESYVPVESVLTSELNSPPSNDPKRDIDYLLGFDVRLLCHFVNIALLIDEVNKHLAEPNSRKDTLPTYIVSAALELKSKFVAAYEKGEESRSLRIDEIIQSKLKRKRPSSPQTSKNMKDLVEHDNILRATNKAYFDAGLLNLYRRVLLLPRSSSIVQDLASEMADILEFGIEPGSPAELCTIFCHFCAGCETLDPVKRHLISQRFTKLSLAGNFNATKSLLIMQRCWDTGEDWITAANALDIDIVLL